MDKSRVLYYTQSIIYGLLLYIGGMVCSDLPYYTLNNSEMFRYLLLVFLFLGAIITFFAVFRRNAGIIATIIRLLITYSSFFLFLILGGYTGLVRSVHTFLNISTSSGSDNISGMIFLTYIIVSLLTGVICLFCALVTRLVRRAR